MPQKFFDVIPPKTSLPPERKPEVQLSRGLAIETGDQVKTPRRTWSKFLIVFLLVAALAIGGVGYSLSAKIEIDLWPDTSEVNLETDISIRTDTEKSDYTNNILMGTKVSSEESISKSFKASGVRLKESKARGTIRVFNNYSTALQTLVVGTRFVSEQGKVFKLLSRQVIPGATRDSKGGLTAGSKDVEVEAAQPGPDYNIESGTFSIPGFYGTDKYTAFYGKSSSPMGSGSSGQVTYITSRDLSEAELVMRNEARDQLKNQILAVPEKYFIQESISYDFSDIVFSYEEDAETEEFSAKLSASASILAVETNELVDFIAFHIATQIDDLEDSSSASINRKTLRFNYEPGLIDQEKGSAQIKLSFACQVYSDIQLDNLIKVIMGQSREDAVVFLERIPGVDKIKVASWPILHFKAPKSPGKIKINLKLD